MSDTKTASDPDRGAPIGYLSSWSYCPSDSLAVHVSCALPWEADVVQLHYGDPRPDGAGLRETPIGVSGGVQAPLVQRAHPGSVAWLPVRGLPASVAAIAWVRPTNLGRGDRQIVVAGQRHDGELAWALAIGDDERWCILRSGFAIATLGPKVGDGWHLAQLLIDETAGVVQLMIKNPAARSPACAQGDASDMYCGELTCLAIGGGRPRVPAGAVDPAPFDGVVAEPCLTRRALSDNELEHIQRGGRIAAVAGNDLLAGWTFPAGREPLGVGEAAVGDVVLHNTPAAAMPGPHGKADALHFHADDLTDASWRVGTRLSLPASISSGVYAVRLRSRDGCDRIPFVIRPGNSSGASVLLLLPTMTYLAYANERLPAPGTYLEHLADDVRPTAIDRWLANHPEFGFSLYDRHADGAGVNYSSLRRPIPNIRPDYLHWASGEPRHLGADLFIVDWLDRTGIPYDVTCDHDLDVEGFSLLEPYRVIVTGSHPEYCTEAMLKALETYLDRQGRLVYLGGNGFYWVTSTSPREPGIIEVRRGRNGFPWRSGEGESTHSFDGSDGGFWADHARPAQDLVGVTFVAMGPEDPAPGYRLRSKLPTSDRWIVEGIEEGAIIGTSGRLMGGAAGHEVDCVEAEYHDPDGITILASSEGHAKTLQLAAERVANAKNPDALVPHADLVLYRRPRGGMVLSTGSICWCGSLAEPGGDRAVQQLTANALRRFLER